MNWQYQFCNKCNSIILKMRVKIIHGLGNHLILDGFAEGDLDSEEFVKSLLVDCVYEVGMKVISKPLVLNYDAEDESESGVTGVIVLAESNITIHTYPKKKYFCFDLFSCNEFDIDHVINFLNKKLGLSKCEIKLLKRGLYDERD